MTRMLVMAGATLGGGIGWWLGEPIGIGAAFVLTVVGTALGTYGARRVATEYMNA